MNRRFSRLTAAVVTALFLSASMPAFASPAQDVFEVRNELEAE